MIDPRFDVAVWGAVLLLFVVMGARAWAVETAEARHYRKSARVRMLNGATALAIVVLVGMMAFQGGVLLVQAIATRTDPETFVTVVGENDGVDQAVPDPDDQPADPNAPPAPPDPGQGAPGPGGAADPGPGAPGQGAPRQGTPGPGGAAGGTPGTP
ncbi:hypothetical protein [Pseudonocardia zijingensis]|jgi:hypothetical protein|uniref:Uncharacterized protein n=1 Tax=Pseudonocardia zijingensis TaxID=153376 RepID=A0ABP3YNW1_9PSEU